MTDPMEDACARDIAACIQQAHGRWLVIWSPWRRQFTAFGSIAPVSVIIDEAGQEELVKKMRAAESHFKRPGGPPYK